MTTFHNRKEDVFDFRITKKGREKLAKGVFRPDSYAFFDTNVIYDNSASVEQNDIEERIKSDLKLRTLSCNKGSEPSKVNTFGYKFYNEIGTVDLTTSSAPAWKIKALEGEFDLSTFNHYPNTIKDLPSSEAGANIERIPQLNVEMVYNIYNEIVEVTPGDGEAVFATNKLVAYFGKESEDILIDIEELNSIYLGEEAEYEIEVYYVSYNDSTGSLTPLNINGPVASSDSVEHYVKITVDDQIFETNDDKTKNIYGEALIQDIDKCEE